MKENGLSDMENMQEKISNLIYEGIWITLIFTLYKYIYLKIFKFNLKLDFIDYFIVLIIVFNENAYLSKKNSMT